MTATSSSTRSSRVMRLDFRFTRKTNSSQCIGSIGDLRSGQNSNRRCWYGKVMSTMFWDRAGILLIDFLPRGETVNMTVIVKHCGNCDVLFKTREVECFTAGVVLLHDNARPHMARRSTAAVLTEFGWELFHHPLFSLILLPMISTFSCTSRVPILQ
ncbi:hypothetical protein TNCV_4552981 [Trichonephila clavipes]|nr:hypothetical protein TNCV_4552981 [Trichonephila clavipes]